MFSTPMNTPSMVSYMQYEPFYQKSKMAADAVVTEMGTIVSSFRISTFEQKTTLPLQVVGQENKQVHLQSDANRDDESNDTL